MFSAAAEAQTYCRRVVKLRFFSSCFEYLDLFVGNRVVRPSESYFSRKVMSEVSISRRRRNPSARSAVPLTCTLTCPSDLSDVPSVAVDLALIVGQLVRPGLQNFGDDEWPFLGRRELVPPSGVLSQPKHQVAHLEVSGPNPSGVVASQGLLIPRRV
jgi:hypothetical protein